jgi:hypothetical protein
VAYFDLVYSDLDVEADDKNPSSSSSISSSSSGSLIIDFDNSGESLYNMDAGGK